MSNFQGLAKALMTLAQNMQNMARVMGLLIMGPEQHCGSEFKGTRPPKECWISSLYRQHTSTIYIWDSQDLIPQVYLYGCIESVSTISVPINPFIYSDCQSSRVINRLIIITNY